MRKVIAILFGGVGMLLITWAIPFRSQYAKDERACVEHRDPDHATAFIDGPSDYRTEDANLERVSANRHGATWQRAIPGYVMRVLARSGVKGIEGHALIFVGARQASDGEQRIVVVLRQGSESGGDTCGMPMKALAVPIQSSPTGGLMMQYRQPANSMAKGIPRGQVFRLFYGQQDGSDPSHFTIRYEWNGVAGTIDGWLRVDDNVELRVRDGPCAVGGTGDKRPATLPGDFRIWRKLQSDGAVFE